MALIPDIADAIVAALNLPAEERGAEWSADFTAARAYVPTYELADLAELRVTVVPRGIELSLASRVEAQRDVQVDVAVQQKLAWASNAEVDALVGLTEEIAEYLRGRRRFELAGGGVALWVRTENVPIYSPEHLAELRTFSSVLTLTLRVVS